MMKTLRTVWLSAAVRVNGRPTLRPATCRTVGDVEIGVADHRIVRRGTLGLPDVLGPFRVLVDGIDAQAHQLDAALVEFRLQLCESAELGGAHRREVLRVREQERPAVADPVVELDFSLGGSASKSGATRQSGVP